MATRKGKPRSIDILKEYSKDITRTMSAVAEVMGTSQPTVSKVVNDFAAAVRAAEQMPDFPHRLLQFYRTDETQLTEEEYMNLSSLVKVIAVDEEDIQHAREQLAVVPEMNMDDSEEDEEEQQEEDDEEAEEEEPRPVIQQPVRRSQPKAERNENYKRQAAPASSRQMSHREQYGPTMSDDQLRELQSRLSTNQGLMMYVLENTRGVGPEQIRKFMNLFALNEEQMVRDPSLLLRTLQMGLGSISGELAFQQFMSLQPKFVQDNNPYIRSYMSGANPAGMMQQYGGNPLAMAYGVQSQTGSTAPLMQMAQQNPEFAQYMFQTMMEEQRELREERRMDKMMRSAMMQNLMSMMHAQTPMNPMAMMGMGGQMGVEQNYDAQGRPIATKFIPQAGGNAGMPAGLETMFKEMAETNRMLLNKTLDSGKSQAEMYKTMLDAYKENGNDFYSTAKKLKDMGIDIFNNNKGGSPQTLEELRMKFDTQMQLFDRKMDFRRMQHDWEKEREDKLASQENMKEWMTSLKDLAENVAGPILGQFAQGAGMAVGKRRAQQQDVMAAQQQQAYAQWQQQQTMRQQQAAQTAAPQSSMYSNMGPQQGAAMQFKPPAPVGQGGATPTPPQSRTEQAIRQHQYNDESFYNMADEELDAIMKEIDQGISKLGPMRNKIEQIREQRAQQRRDSQAQDYFRMRAAQAKAKEAAALAQTRGQSAPMEFFPAIGGREEPQQTSQETQAQTSAQQPVEAQGAEEYDEVEPYHEDDSSGSEQ